jgi:hypothetical protein
MLPQTIVFRINFDRENTLLGGFLDSTEITRSSVIIGECVLAIITEVTELRVISVLLSIPLTPLARWIPFLKISLGK